MASEPDRTRARELARESLAAGDVTGWFERLYQESDHGAVVPWAELRPNPNLTDWWDAGPSIEAAGRTALVVGCGLGDDAEALASWGFKVTAFDVAPTAIAKAGGRFPSSTVDYQTVDLFSPPSHWKRAFDFVFESYTLQALPVNVRGWAVRKIASFLAPAGHLLLIARARDATDPAGNMPWPLTEEDLAQFERLGLAVVSWEDYMDGSIRRFRVLYQR